MDRDALKNKAFNGVKFTLIAQILVLLLSIIKSFIVPKILSIPDYGYWQVYVLYSSYVGLFALGYNDGIYLKYGKYQYEDLPFDKLRRSNSLYFIMLSLFTIIMSSLCLFIKNDYRQFSMISVSFDIIFMGINGLFIYIFQVTNKFKEYSIYSTIDKILLLILILVICFFPETNFKYVVIADVISKGVVSIMLCFKCKDLILGYKSTFKEGWKEFSMDIKCGINLMIANLMGMFVTGIGRLLVDNYGDISEYAYYSFGITITNLVLVFITAISLVLYPTLKRLPTNNYDKYFRKLDLYIVIFNSIAILSYFPAIVFLNVFFSQYSELLVYLHFLFGVVILEAKMQLINNTFFKVLREEKELLRVNIYSVIIFSIISFIAYSFIRKVYIIAICTFLAMLFRCYYSERYIRKKIGIQFSKDQWIEILYILSIMIVISIVDAWIAFLISLILLVLFIRINLTNIKENIDVLKWRVK